MIDEAADAWENESTGVQTNSMHLQMSMREKQNYGIYNAHNVLQKCYEHHLI